MKRLVLLISLCAFPAASGLAQTKSVDCYCTDKGGARVEMGQRLCMQVDGRMFTAECQMSLNVPMWREVGEGCLTSAPSQSIQPAANAG